MYVFIKITAFFWTLAEIIIIFYLNWGNSLIKGKGKGEKIFTIICIALSVSLALLLFWGDTLLGKSIDFNSGYNLYYYQNSLYNFFCTIWVVLEGIIMIYILTIYKSMKNLLTNKNTVNNDISIARSSFHFLNLFIVFSFFIILSFIALYISYEYNLISLAINHNLSIDNFQNLSLVYIRICGVFWVIFEGVVAFMGFKTYSLFKNSEMDMS